VIGSGKSTVSKALAGLLGWRLVVSGDVARAVDAGTAATGAMADAAALDAALLPLLAPGPVVLDGYPRTAAQLMALPPGFAVVMLDLDPDVALARVVDQGKRGWDHAARMDEQRAGLEAVAQAVDLRVDVTGKTPGEIVFEIISSEELA
jgi:adenylate kinase family enzyme